MILKTNREKLIALRQYFQEKCEQAAKLEEATSNDTLKGIQCGRKYAYQNAEFMVQCLLDEEN